MKSTLLLGLLAVALQAALPAWSHSEPSRPANAAQAVAVPIPGAGQGTRDARSYFTDLELLNQEGRKLRFYSDVLEGRTVVINVIYTSCKDACPLITQKLNELRLQMGPAFGKELVFVTLTSDPQRDTPARLKQFAKEQGVDVNGWIFLTGDKRNVDQILKRLGQYSEYLEGHSTQLIAGNVPAKRWSKIRPDAPVPAVAQRLQMLMGDAAAASTQAP